MFVPSTARTLYATFELWTCLKCCARKDKNQIVFCFSNRQINRCGQREKKCRKNKDKTSADREETEVQYLVHSLIITKTITCIDMMTLDFILWIKSVCTKRLIMNDPSNLRHCVRLYLIEKRSTSRVIKKILWSKNTPQCYRGHEFSHFLCFSWYLSIYYFWLMSESLYLLRKIIAFIAWSAHLSMFSPKTCHRPDIINK